jgi:hypothetical protein
MYPHRAVGMRIATETAPLTRLFFDQLRSAFFATCLYVCHLVDVYVAFLLCAESTPYGIVRLRVLGRGPARGVSGLPSLGLEETVQNWSVDC